MPGIKYVLVPDPIGLVDVRNGDPIDETGAKVVPGGKPQWIISMNHYVRALALVMCAPPEPPEPVPMVDGKPDPNAKKPKTRNALTVQSAYAFVEAFKSPRAIVPVADADLQLALEAADEVDRIPLSLGAIMQTVPFLLALKGARDRPEDFKLDGHPHAAPANGIVQDQPAPVQAVA